MRYILLFILEVLFCLEGKGQNPDLVDKYLKSVEYNDHLKEAYQIHYDLIRGEITPLLRLLISDSIPPRPHASNLEIINDLIGSDDFRFHCARIDTSVAIGSTPKYSTGIKFRDIYYLGNNQFYEYQIWIHISWDPESRQTKRRTISVYNHTIPSRKAWGRGIWHNEQGIYNGLEK